jgi:NADPH2:quinone reductase
MRALTFSRFGSPEVLEVREIADPERRPGHSVVRLEAIGLNFVDIYRRHGNDHLAGDPPWIAGYEGAGVIASVPEGSPFRPGDRVGRPLGPRRARRAVPGLSIPVSPWPTPTPEPSTRWATP